MPKIRASGYYGGWLAEADADITLIKQAGAGFRDAATLPIQGGVGELIDPKFYVSNLILYINRRSYHTAQDKDNINGTDG